MDFLKNILVNLKATGPAAVLCVWCICVTILGVFGGEHAGQAFTLLSVSAGLMIITLAQRA